MLWRADNQRDTGIEFKNRGLASQAVFADMQTMIGPENDDRVLTQAERLQFAEHAPYLRIEIADGREMTVVHFAKLLRVGTATITETGQSDGGNIGRWRHVAGNGDLLAIVEIPVLLRSVERHVWFPESDGQKERLITSAEISQRLDSGVGNASIEVGIVRHIAAFGSSNTRNQIWRQLTIDLRFVVSVVVVVQNRRDAPRGRVAFPIILSPVVKDFPDTLSVVAAAFE